MVRFEGYSRLYVILKPVTTKNIAMRNYNNILQLSIFYIHKSSIYSTALQSLPLAFYLFASLSF